MIGGDPHQRSADQAALSADLLHQRIGVAAALRADEQPRQRFTASRPDRRQRMPPPHAQFWSTPAHSRLI